MANWSELKAAAPGIAERGCALLVRSGAGEGLLTTVANGQLPRTHPVTVGIVGDRLMVFVHAASPKARDLETDGRFALHAHQDPGAPHELLVRGRAAVVRDAETRGRAAASWPFAADDDYALYDLAIEHVLLGERADPNEWPPRYTSWRATATATATATAATAPPAATAEPTD